MSQDALAPRVGLSKPTLAGLERSEQNSTITLTSLARVADALDCTLVYGFIPRTSLQDTVEREARVVAAESLGYVVGTMALEDQAVPSDRTKDQLESEVQRVIADHRIWSAPRTASKDD